MKLRFLLVLVLASTTGHAFAQETKVTLKKLGEKRELTLEKSAFGGWDNGIDLLLHVDGAGVAGAKKVGKLKATLATDDVGTDLTRAPADVPRAYEGYQDVQPTTPFGNADAPKPTGFDVQLRLPTTTARHATTINQLTGEMSVLVGGEQKTVLVKNVKAALGQTISDPALKEAGLTFTLVDPAQRGAKDKMIGALVGGSTGLSAVIEGNVDVIDSVEIVNSAGEKLSNGSYYDDKPGKRSVTYMTAKPLPEDATLQIVVNVGQTAVAVPFSFKGVKLP